jgi:hypothetical protein
MRLPQLRTLVPFISDLADRLEDAKLCLSILSLDPLDSIISIKDISEVFTWVGILEHFDLVLYHQE